MKSTTKKSAPKAPKPAAATPPVTIDPPAVYNPRINPREVTGHHVNGLNEAIRILVRDEPGPGGANHQYELNLETLRGPMSLQIQFQNGPIQEAGHNGWTNEALLAVVEDRLDGFAAGPVRSKETADALEFVRLAIGALKHRTLSRQARGVEGTSAQ